MLIFSQFSIPSRGRLRLGSQMSTLRQVTTVGARIPNAFGIRMVYGRSVLVPTIRNQNFQNGRSKLGRLYINK